MAGATEPSSPAPPKPAPRPHAPSPASETKRRRRHAAHTALAANPDVRQQVLDYCRAHRGEWQGSTKVATAIGIRPATSIAAFKALTAEGELEHNERGGAYSKYRLPEDALDGLAAAGRDEGPADDAERHGNAAAGNGSRPSPRVAKSIARAEREKDTADEDERPETDARVLDSLLHGDGAGTMTEHLEADPAAGICRAGRRNGNVVYTAVDGAIA